jgi:hypothetical protein
MVFPQLIGTSGSISSYTTPSWVPNPYHPAAWSSLLLLLLHRRRLACSFSVSRVWLPAIAVGYVLSFPSTGEDFDIVLCDLQIPRDQRQCFCSCLCDQHSVKRIAMVHRKGPIDVEV